MEKETSCINTKAIIEYVKVHHNNDCSILFGDLHPEIDVIQDPEGFFMDPNNWISCEVVAKLHARAKSILNDEMAPYKMAKFAIENFSLGYIQKIFVKTFWSYHTALKHIQKINDKFNRSKDVELVEIKRNGAVIRLHWNPKMHITKDMCLYNQGAYVFGPIIWRGRPLILKEKCCYLDGEPFCEYHLKWTPRNRFHEIFSRFVTSKSVLEEMIKEMETDKKIIERKYEEVATLNIELNQKIKQLMAIQETGKAILSLLDLNQLLAVIMNILGNVCRIKRAIIMLVNEDEQSLEHIHSFGLENRLPDEIKNYKVPLGRLNNILARVANTGRAEYVQNVAESGLRKENIMLTYAKPASIYVVPLITRSRVIGVIATDAVNYEGVPKETRETMEVFAPQIAIAIENAKLYQRLREQMDELRRSQALLSRAEKLSFLGNLAARLAHEIKNPMTSIGTFIQMLSYKWEDEEFRNDFYKIAMEETNRVNNLITGLMDLVKTKESHFEFIDIHDLIEKMILLVSPRSNVKNIMVIRKFDIGIGEAWLDSEKMKQIILNLLSNAVEFTPYEGKIEVITGRCNESDRVKGLLINIKDNGEGIPGSIINQIFDPYFTTKHGSGMQNGTGLGLFIVHQNVQDHGGTLEVKSEVGEGTEFLITLPLKSGRFQEAGERRKK